MLKKKICIVTGTRAEFGLLKPLIKKIADSDDMELRLVVTGMHLCNEFGYTCSEIEDEGIAIDRKIEMQLSSDTKTGMTISTGLGIISFAQYFENRYPDILIILGDRYEIFSCVIAASFVQIPIAHLYGGETISGVIDEFIRHAITKMSSLHFVACEAYRKRVIQLGENPQMVFNVGAMGIENVKNMSLLSIEELGKDLNIDMRDQSYCVVTFHPLTLEQDTGGKQVQALINALDEFPDMWFIITKSNSDAGGREINRLWDEYAAAKKNCLVVASLGVQRYLSALRYASMMIGNSSSGITEGPASGIPILNIGDRQKGRIMADSVICCNPEKDAIIQAMKKALTPQFRKIAKEVVNPYGDGTTSVKIMKIIRDQLTNNKIKIKKEFYDVEFDEKDKTPPSQDGINK
ncbi:UDP-N-acetyl glucosamine 2-epimerase [Spirochaetia bacterium]|nr:UDP-N-acetyl glucosamine 2-epimerase [Spirochaetia bacterium]